jgi:hypothetical protein
MTLERNAGDLKEHENDFALRRGFTYSVVSQGGGGGGGGGGGSQAEGEVIGCVYIYPSAKADVEADVRSWVRATRADLDTAVYHTVVQWLQAEWPFSTFDYAPREGAASD